MKAKSRRRLLLSSVAMLLVAMLALGTATFAWFTTQTSTTASGINVKTSKQSTIMVSSRTKTWTNNLNYEISNRILAPTSSKDGSNWFYTVAGDGTKYDASNTPKAGMFGSVTTQQARIADEGHMVYEMLNVKNVGAAATTKDVHITCTLTENIAKEAYDYLRVAIVPAKNGENDVTDATKADATVESEALFRDNIYANDTDSWHPVSAMNATTGAITADTTSIAAKGKTIDVNVGKLNPDQAKYYMLIVWFEGQDEDCYDAAAGNALDAISFSVAEATT